MPVCVHVRTYARICLCAYMYVCLCGSFLVGDNDSQVDEPVGEWVVVLVRRVSVVLCQLSRACSC